MVSVDTLKSSSLFQNLNREVLATFAGAAEIIDLDNNSVIVRQHDRAIAFYVLLSGQVQFLINVEGAGKLLVGIGDEPGVVIGWAVFRAPYRYTTDVRCAGPCRLLRIPHHLFDQLLQDSPHSALRILRQVAKSMGDHLEAERAMLLATTDKEAEPRLPPKDLEPLWSAERLDSVAAIEAFLAESPFFEEQASNIIHWLAEQAVVQTYAVGTRLFEQDTIADQFYLLATGRVGFNYCDSDGQHCVFLRAIEGVGDPIGWSALVDPRRYHTSAVAMEKAVVIAIPSIALEKLLEQDPVFGIRLMQRIIQVIGSRLRFTRVRLVARRYREDLLAVRALLEQSAETLPVTSALHKIPYLLENRLTLADAFHALELTRSHGDANERNLAGLCLEVLQNLHRELHFYSDLQQAYEAVANAPEDLNPEQVRDRSMEAFIKLFGKLSYRTAGEQNLPPQAGNLVIMNHLENHMDTMLPNGFRLTLDSHFVSSMILYRHYGEAPVRVVRKPEFGWFGYQYYFDRLDYIYVYPGDVDQEDRDQHVTRHQRNAHFIERASAHINRGRNLIIAPEGRCSFTVASPGPFRTGAFRLAAAIDPEPLIVPIAVANFDKKLTRTTTAAIVFPPFRLSDRCADPHDETLLHAAVDAIQAEFQEYVRQAIRLAESG